MVNSVGKEVENLAQNYLQQHGLKLVAANYRCKCGEIDLIMRDGETLVFVEVRYRQSCDYGDGVASVNKSKQHKIRKTASYYLQQHRLYDKVNCRFDIIAVSGNSKDQVQWLQDAFWERW